MSLEQLLRRRGSAGYQMHRPDNDGPYGPQNLSWATPQQQSDCCECFKLILARCGPHHRSPQYGQTILHEAVSRDHGVGVKLATILLDAGARLDVRDKLLLSTPLGWACRWGRTEMVKLFLARGADPIESDAEPWASPRAWAEKTERTDILQLLGSRQARS